MGSGGKANAWIDVLLLGGVLIAGLGACCILALMAWQTPEVIRVAYRPTATWTATLPPTPIPTDTPNSTAIATPRATAMPSSLPSAADTPQPTPTPTRTLIAVSRAAPARTVPGDKWIEINVSEQTLIAYQGRTPVLSAPVSTGKPNTPTPLGEFAIYARVPIQDMGGPGYAIPNVRYVVYFVGDYAIHAAHWHDNFGQPMSHGCVNMRTADAQWLYGWAPIGTLVQVHD